MNEQDPQVPPTPPAPEETPSPSAGGSRWWQDRRRLAGAAAGVAVVAAVGVGGGYALGSAGGGSDAQTAGRVGGQFGGPSGGQFSGRSNGQPGGRFRGGPPMQGQVGGADGEQHVTGTLSAVGTGSVTVKTSSGTQTYQVTAATQILQDGGSVRLSQLTTGEPVVVHVFPGGTADGTAERVLVGSSATDGGFGLPPDAA